MSHQIHKIGEDQDLSTGVFAGKAQASSVDIFFDKNCFLCRSLAHFISRSSAKVNIHLEPSLEEVPKDLMIRINSVGVDPVDLFGEAAWHWLLLNHPSLQSLNWLAEKIGIQKKTSRVLYKTTDFLRHTCRNCPKEPLR
jgi:hypothetical protein